MEQIQTYVLENQELRLDVMNLGATITGLRYRGQELVLRYEYPEDYLKHDAYLGAVIGRYANRIHKATASIGEQAYQLVPNEGQNQLHGGPNSFDKRIWTADVVEKDRLHFRLESPDGDNGYPGNLVAGVSYSITENKLRIEFDGMADQDTLYAPTTHVYFSFGNETVLNSELQIAADNYLAVDDQNIPTGIKPVDKTFDFRTMRKIGQNYDHCFPLTGEKACCLQDQGIRMEIYTDFPAIQVYTGGFLNGPHRPNQGIALEPEFYPDSPNHPEFPTAVLKKGETFQKYVEYRFERCM